MNKYQNDIVPLCVATQTTSSTSRTLITYSVLFRGRIEAKNSIYTILIPLLCCWTSRANSANISYAFASAFDEWKLMFGQFERRRRFLWQKGSHSTAYEVNVVHFNSPKSSKYKKLRRHRFSFELERLVGFIDNVLHWSAEWQKQHVKRIQRGRVDSIIRLICCRLSPQHQMDDYFHWCSA